MTSHQLWIDALNVSQQQGKTLSEALTVADSVWPFKYVNDQQTEASKALEALPEPKPLTGFDRALQSFDQHEEQEALL